jgi:hypothetical protein
MKLPLNPGSLKYNEEQLICYIKLFREGCFSNLEKYKSSSLQLLSHSGIDCVEDNIIPRIIDGFDIRRHSDIQEFYRNECIIPISDDSCLIMKKLYQHHMSPAGKAAWYGDFKAIKLFNADFEDAILIASYKGNLECLKKISDIQINLNCSSRYAMNPVFLAAYQGHAEV